MGGGHRCDRADDVGAYLLGALDDAEAGSFREHLAGCALCAEDFEELRSAVDVLPATAPAMEAPPELKHRIMAVVEREAALLAAAGPGADRPAVARAPKRRWSLGGLSVRPGVAVAASAVLLAVGVAGGALVVDGGGPSGSARTLAASIDTSQAPAATARLRVEGATARLNVSGMPNPETGRVYQVWLQRDGKVEPTDVLFTPSRHGRAAVEIPGSISGVQRVMVTSEPMGGSEQPTRQPVITVATV